MAVTNGDSNDNSNTTRPEEATNTEAADEQEDVESSKDENKDELFNESESKNKNHDNQKCYSNNGTEEATYTGADTEVINVEVSRLRSHVENFHASGAGE